MSFGKRQQYTVMTTAWSWITTPETPWTSSNGHAQHKTGTDMTIQLVIINHSVSQDSVVV
jgi:hypothetical protein